MTKDTVAGTIAEKLEQALAPEHLTVVDDSHHHVGHAGARAGGETHFSVEIVSSKFDGLSRLQRQRLVYKILSEELEGPVHALSIAARTPNEVSIDAKKYKIN
jgi:BolA protein